MKKSTLIASAVLLALLAAALLYVAKKPTATIQAVVAPTPVAAPALAPAAQQPTSVPMVRPPSTLPPAAAPDALSVVKAALPAAQAGDGRAAYKISLVLTTCAWELSAPDPEARLQQYLLHPNMPQWVRDMRLSQLQWCIGLVKKPPFGELPATPEYWMAQAYAAGDPLAQEEKAADAAHALMGDVQHLMSPTERAAKVQIVQDNLRAAVESGDPEVLFRAGVLMANPFLVTDTTPGNAVALAACDLGRDCTVANPICMQEGRCPAGQDFPMLLQQGMSPADYAKLYARSQQIVLDMRAGNYDAVLANLTITK